MVTIYASPGDSYNIKYLLYTFLWVVPRSQDVVVEPFFAILNYISDIASVLC